MSCMYNEALSLKESNQLLWNNHKMYSVVSTHYSWILLWDEQQVLHFDVFAIYANLVFKSDYDLLPPEVRPHSSFLPSNKCKCARTWQLNLKWIHFSFVIFLFFRLLDVFLIWFLPLRFILTLSSGTVVIILLFKSTWYLFWVFNRIVECSTTVNTPVYSPSLTQGTQSRFIFRR